MKHFLHNYNTNLRVVLAYLSSLVRKGFLGGNDRLRESNVDNFGFRCEFLHPPHPPSTSFRRGQSLFVVIMKMYIPK